MIWRSPSWLDKWWAEYGANPRTDFADHSRAPHVSPWAIPEPVRRAVITVRQTLEAATTPETRYGLIGPRAIQTRLERLKLPIPSPATLQRILQAEGLTHPIGAGHDAAYYPWPLAWTVNAIHATDIITRHLRGGEEVQNFHTIDHYSHAAYLSQQVDKRSATTCAHLLDSWQKLGLPQIEQLDNEDAFRGGHTHPRVIGQVVRLCLFCGVEPLFIPFYEPKRNYQIETFLVCGCTACGPVINFATVPTSRSRRHSLSTGITRSINRRAWGAVHPPSYGAGSRSCAWMPPCAS